MFIVLESLKTLALRRDLSMLSMSNVRDHAETSGFHRCFTVFHTVSQFSHVTVSSLEEKRRAQILDLAHLGSLISMRSLAQLDSALPVFDIAHAEFSLSSHGSLQSGHRYKN